MTGSESEMSDWRVLVPVQVLEGQTVSESIAELLSTVPVVVLGYHVLPEQTPPGQARMQFEQQAQTKLDDLAAEFREAGGAADTRLVFTHDQEQTFDRIAAETDCQTVLIPNPAPDVRRLLVPLRGEVDVDRVASFVTALIGDRQIDVTCYHVAASETETNAGQALVDRAATVLRDEGIPDDAIATEVVVSDTPVRAIATAAAEYDAIVMGESEPSLRTFLFGEAAEQVATQSLGPVLVVRRPEAS
jgi:nucleotide-binding universal stress UspA family protein